jgi:selenocysteine lyase/cysteine desulfurase
MSDPAAARAAIDIDRIRAQFPSLAETDDGRPRIYLDNPAGTQVPQIVADRMADCLLHRSANIGGYFRTSELAGESRHGRPRQRAVC